MQKEYWSVLYNANMFCCSLCDAKKGMAVPAYVFQPSLRLEHIAEKKHQAGIVKIHDEKQAPVTKDMCGCELGDLTLAT